MVQYIYYRNIASSPAFNMKTLKQLKSEAREKFRKEFWKLSGGSPGELDKKQDDYVDTLITTAYNAGLEAERQKRYELWKEAVHVISESEVHINFEKLQALTQPNNSK